MISVPESIALRLDVVVQNQFSVNDFHKVEMRSIAAEAGMSLRTIYEYFSNKETLLFWFINRWISPLKDETLKILKSDASFKQKMYDRLKLHLDFYTQRIAIGRIIFLTVPLERWMQDESFAYKEPTAAMMEEVKKAQQAGDIRSDIAPLVILDAFGGIFNRIFLMWEYRGRSPDLTQQLDQHFDIIYRGISAS